MGGQIGASGEPGKGAAFWIALPLPRADTAQGGAPMTAA